jgi:hypothetical protein
MIQVQKLRKCAICNKPTDNVAPDGEAICERCWKEIEPYE